MNQRFARNDGSLRGGVRSAGVFGSERSYVIAPLSLRSDHPHLVPVVGKFSSTIQAGHVGPGQGAGLRSACRSSNGDREAIAGMMATEKQVNHLCDHGTPSTTGSFFSWVVLFLGSSDFARSERVRSASL